MKIATAAEMREIDRITIEEVGIPGMVLMENAGIQVVNTIKEMLENPIGKRVWVFAGGGNNGGDGLVVARHLFNHGAKVKVVLLTDPSSLKGDAWNNYLIAQRMNIEMMTLASRKDLMALKISLPSADLIVDAIFGTGLKGEVKGDAAEVIRMINSAQRPVVSVDIPSGLHADTGEVLGVCVQAAKTVTFGLPKVGLCLQLNSEYVGELVVADISIPRQVVMRQNLQHHLIHFGDIVSLFPPRPRESHKGTYGHLLVVAGSEGYTGAAALASLSALRVGTGLVTLGVPESLHDLMEIKLTEVMTKPLPETKQRTVSLRAVDPILDALQKCHALAVGPGLSVHPEVSYLLENLLSKVEVPVVLDADGLNAIADNPEVLKSCNAPVVITPHPGEMSRLCKLSVHQVQKNRLQVAKEFAQSYGVTVVLKGHRTVVADPKGNVYINSTGNPGMATGGTGDVLTGIIGGFLAQGLQPVQAATAGVFLHGLAGDFAAREKSESGLIAGDILEKLPYTMKELEN